MHGGDREPTRATPTPFVPNPHAAPFVPAAQVKMAQVDARAAPSEAGDDAAELQEAANAAASEFLRRQLCVGVAAASADGRYECSVDLEHMVDDLLDDPDDYDASVRALERLCAVATAGRQTVQPRSF